MKLEARLKPRLQLQKISRSWIASLYNQWLILTFIRCITSDLDTIGCNEDDGIKVYVEEN